MSIDLMSLIGDLKTCLALALGSGLLFGYLYTKFKARELFKPEIKGLKKKIKHHQLKSQSLLSKNGDIKKKLEGYEAELHNYNLEATKYKDKLSEAQQKMRTLESEGVHIKTDHQRQQKILDGYNTEIKELKSKLDLDDLSKIDEHKANLALSATKVENRYKQKCDLYEGFVKDKTALTQENHDLKSKLSSLTAELNKKGLELIDKGDIVSTIREKLQNEYEDLLANKKENETKIEQYRKQLLAIKDKLS
jgi:chromosome segregation ATPase